MTLAVSGIGATHAARLCSIEAASSGDPEDVARRDRHPTARQVAHLLEQWRKEEWPKEDHAGYEGAGMMAALEKYALSRPELPTKIEADESHYCIALVTPFMRRVHKEMKEAAEVVFVDATAAVDRTGSTVVPLVCASPAGALPLGVVIASAQDEKCLTAGRCVAERECATLYRITIIFSLVWKATVFIFQRSKNIIFFCACHNHFSSLRFPFFLVLATATD